MATTTNEKVSWSDIQNIYTSLRSCQSKFGMSQTAIPSNPGVVKPEVVSNLKSAIFGLSSNSYVKKNSSATSALSTVFNMANPTVGSLIKPAPFDTMESTLTTVSSVCVNDANFGNFGNFGDVGFCAFDSVQGYQCFADPGCSADIFCNAFF